MNVNRTSVIIGAPEVTTVSRLKSYPDKLYLAVGVTSMIFDDVAQWHAFRDAVDAFLNNEKKNA